MINIRVSNIDNGTTISGITDTGYLKKYKNVATSAIYLKGFKNFLIQLNFCMS